MAGLMPALAPAGFPMRALSRILQTMNTRVGVIGFGAIGQSIVDAWRAHAPAGQSLVALLVREYQREEATRRAPPGVTVCTTIEDFLACQLATAVEVAGHGAVHAYGEALLSAGVDLMLISVGTLTDETLHARLNRAAATGRSRLLLPAGAIAGLDGLRSLKKEGLREVTYTSTKPPASWTGTPAEQAFRLDELTQRTVLFSGSAAEAARLYPKNANLAATVALAGLGLAHTRVELVADPAITQNVGRIDAASDSSRMSLVMAGESAASNPKTSLITGMSVLAALENQGARLAFI